MPPQRDPYAAIAEHDPYASIAEGAEPTELPANILKQRIQALAEQNKTPLPEVKRDQSIPGYLQQMFTERAGENAQAAQGFANIARGPEAENRNLLTRAAAASASVPYEVAAVLDKVGAGLMDPKAAIAMVGSKILPTAAAGYFLYQGLKGAKEASGDGKVFSKWPNPDNVQNFLLGLSTAAASGASIKATSPPLLEKAGDVLHKGAQHLAGAGPEQTTAPMVQKVAQENARVAEANRANIERTERANQATAIKVEKANQGITDDAFRKAGEQRADYEAKVKAQDEKYAKEKAEVESYNEQVARVEAQRTKYNETLQQGSLQLGESVKSISEALREEVNDNYAPIHEAAAKDPGVPAEELANDVRAAQKQYLKGSSESIRIFNDILKKGEPSQEIHDVRSGKLRPIADEVLPGTALWDDLVAKGIIEVKSQMVQFDNLQGYSSEIGAKLASGNLPGDVYQALKSVKESLDAKKAVIANRLGMGPQLKVADSFFSDFQKVFYNRPSAVAGTLQRVGKFDPQFYSEPFIKGKTAETGIQALRDIKTKLPATRSFIDQTAELASSLRETDAAMKRLPKSTHPKPLPERPAPVPRPAPVEATYKEKPTPKQPKLEPKPAAPTLEEVRNAKKAEIQARSAQWRGLNRYEIGFLLGSPIATLIKGGLKTAAVNLVADIGYISGKQIAANIVVKPRVIEWLSKPRPEDIAILKKLPQADQAALRTNMQNFIRKEQVKNVSPLVTAYIVSGAAQQKTPGQMKKEIQAIRDRETPQPSSNPF